jgi:hypothetical protein
MLSYFSQLEFPVVSGQHILYKYQNIEALYICPHHIFVPFSCGTKSQLVSFSLDLKNLYPFLSAIYQDLVSYLMEPTGTEQVNATCPVGSTLS